MPKVTFVFPENLLAAAQALAKLRGESVSEVVRFALKEYVLTEIPKLKAELETYEDAAELASRHSQHAGE